MGNELQGLACIAFGIADFFLGGLWIVIGVIMILVGLALIFKKDGEPENKRWKCKYCVSTFKLKKDRTKHEKTCLGRNV